MSKSPKYEKNYPLQEVANKIKQNRQFTKEWSRYLKITNKFFGLMAWRRIRQEVLEDSNYLCEQCIIRDLNKSADVCDHIIPRSWVYYRYFLKERNVKKIYKAWLNRDNLQALCRYCHELKTRNVESRLQHGKGLKEGFKQVLYAMGQLDKFNEWFAFMKENNGSYKNTS